MGRIASTKSKIIYNALRLFNERGFVNVNLRDIASATGISVGNLAYHYANKSVIIEVLYEKMESSLQVYWEGLNQVPSFANVARYLTYFLQLQEAYSFFYQDMLEIERSHPEIGEKHQVHIERQIANVRAMIDYSVQAGNMQPEARSGLYDHLANTVWMMLNFWLTQKQIRKQAAQISAMEAIWMLVIPHLTTKGEAHLASLIPETIPLHP